VARSGTKCQKHALTLLSNGRREKWNHHLALAAGIGKEIKSSPKIFAYSGEQIVKEASRGTALRKAFSLKRKESGGTRAEKCLVVVEICLVCGRSLM